MKNNNARGNYSVKYSSWKKIIHFDLDGFYLCNSKCRTYPQKRTKEIKKVTCSCCLSKLRRNEELKKEIVKVNGDFEIKEEISKPFNYYQGPKGWNEDKKKKLREVINSIKLR